MEKVLEEEKTLSSNDKKENKCVKVVKEKYFLIKKCKRNEYYLLGKKTLIRKKMRKITSNVIINNKSNSHKMLKNNKNNNINQIDKKIKAKIIIIHFNNIKKLGEHIFSNFSLLFQNEVDDKNKDIILFDIWQCLNILNNKLIFLQKEKLFKPEKTELETFNKIKDILLNIKKSFTDNMSKNLRNILNNIELFCNKYSK